MLVKPEIQDESIMLCLQQEYGLQIDQLVFLPLGGDLCSAVYRALAQDGSAYFCKLRCADFEEISVELPKFLSDQGITQIIPPIVTQTGGLWAELGEFKLILYAFIQGTSGFEIVLTERQWADFSTALKRIHSTSLPAQLSRKIKIENFSPEWRERCREVIKRLDHETFDEPIMLGMAAYLLPKREIILNLLDQAERLAQVLAARSLQFVLCHADIHPGNLFIDTQGSLFIVDWDYPILAPKERDLMFIGGGQGYMSTTAQEEERLFYRNYDQSTLDLNAMAYYRCERNLIDISVETRRIFSTKGSEQDRAQSLQILTWLFLPEGSVEMAYKDLKNIA